MSGQPPDQIGRRFEFDPTEAVVRSRASGRFISCPACGADAERYLFHERGARFVQCRSCDVVYVNPPARELRDYFDIPSDGGRVAVEDREHVRKELDDVLRYASDTFRAHRGSAPARVVVAGRMPDHVSIASPAQINAVRLTRDETLRLVNEADVSPIVAALCDDVELVVLNQLLEACPHASDVVAALAAHLPSEALLVVVYSNAASLPGRVMRRNWRRFFHWKAVYFNSENLRGMLERAGLRFVEQSGLNTSYTVTRALGLALPGTPMAGIARRLGLGAATARVPTGTYVSTFEHARRSETNELLSVIVPVYNEGAYLRSVLDELLSKQFVVPHEVVIVESNSTDGTRDIVRTLRGAPGTCRSSTRTGRAARDTRCARGSPHVTGTIVLIQDADFEYDIDDYDALLEPILQHKAHVRARLAQPRARRLEGPPVRRDARPRPRPQLRAGASSRGRTTCSTSSASPT